jgi:hypothetical protein
MKTKTQITKSIRPDFYYRYCELFHDDRDLTDSINIMATRATSMLYLLSAQFEGEDDNTLPSHVICDSICSVINEIQDIQAYLKAFSDAQKKPR